MSRPGPLVNEATSHRVPVSFWDETRTAAVPQAVSVRLDDELSGAAIRAPQALTPAAAVVVEITAAENELVDPARVEEPRVLTVVATYGSGRQATAEYHYRVRNLRFYEGE